MENKTMEDQLFELVSAEDVNRYLQSFLKSLTAKTFRTMHSSLLFQKELNKVIRKYENYDEDDKVNALLDEYSRINLAVASLCNHQKK